MMQRRFIETYAELTAVRPDGCRYFALPATRG